MIKCMYVYENVGVPVTNSPEYSRLNPENGSESGILCVDLRIAKYALDWNPQESRKQGRPVITWRHPVWKEALEGEKALREVKALAMNRTRWKSFVEAL